MSLTGGVFIYVGKTQSGKTTKALGDLRGDIAGNGYPALILDCGPAVNFAGTAHQDTVRAVLVQLYGHGSHAVYTPRGVDDADRLFDAITDCGGVNILVDEVRWLVHNKYISTAFTKALRHWAHGREGPVTWRCTSQRPADLHRDFYACLTGELYAFRVDPGPDMDRLVAECAFDADTLGSLPRGSYLTFSGKWEEAAGSPPDPVPGAERAPGGDEEGPLRGDPGVPEGVPRPVQEEDTKVKSPESLPQGRDSE